MDQGHRIYKEVNPRKNANILSIITFWYNLKILLKGKKKDITEKDVYQVLSQFEAEKLGSRLEIQWEKDKNQHKNASILLCLTKCFGWTYFFYFILQLAFGTGMLLLQPKVFSKFVAYFETGQTSLTVNDAYLFASAVVGLDLLNKIFNQNFSQLVAEYSMKVRTALCSLIYRKALKISPIAFSEITIGKVVTFVSKDIYSIDGALMFFKDMIIGFLQLAVITYLLYQKVGLSAFFAIGVLLIVILLQLFGGVIVKENRLKTVKKSDERYKILQEALSAIKIIKMYLWQNYFKTAIESARLKEIAKLRIVYFLKAFIIAFGGSANNLAFYFLLISYIAKGYKIDAETVYYVQQCLAALGTAISTSIPFGITQTADTIASMQRIQAFLVAEELPKSNNKKLQTEKCRINLTNVTIKIRCQEILNSISLNLDKGLLLITGNTGGGKSILLKTILQEYPISNGKIDINGTLSYAPEEPWLFPSTIRQNILFGQDYDENRYQEVLKVCALVYDINKFKKLDETIVGDKGINLSKGQQARISLARAVYRDSDIYLLDGCLNSLDNNVSNFIFNKCIKGFLKSKICVLVTNNENYIRLVKRSSVLCINNGKIVDIPEQTEIKSAKQIIEKMIDHTEEYENTLEIPTDKQQNLNTLSAENQENDKEIENLYHEENREGKVLWSTYSRYYRFLGGIFVCLYLLLVFSAAQFCTSAASKLISNWVNLESRITEMINKNETNSTDYKNALNSRNQYLTIYTALITVGMVLFILKGCSTFYFCLNAAKKLHHAMVVAMLNCYMYFFDDHFIGNIINRLSKDFYTIDEYMPFLVFDCSRSFFSSVGVIVLLSTVNWGFIILIVLLFVTLFFLLRFYLPTGRSLRRLEAATRSPIIGYLNSTLEGISIIRAAQQQDNLKFEFDRHQDLYTSAYYMNQTTTRFFAFLVDILGNLFILGITYKFIMFPDGTQAGDVGLAISQAMALSNVLQWVFKQIAEVETVMTSVERVSEYADATVEKSTGRELDNWPSNGRITFDQVTLKYKSDGNTVLQDITFEIEAKSKVGIVGRTGAGKSSIVSALFRLYDYVGEIKIDSEDIGTLPLDDLRSKISIIPQDPIVFSGTIKDNIDPLQTYSDNVIWKALKMVHLDHLISNLNQIITDSSINLSLGQKQLLCLARAIVQKNKIIVLDEATANLDEKTDQLLQNIIQNGFKDCTM